MKIFRILKLYKDDERGVAAMEFALVSIAFLTVLFGIIQSSHMLWVYNGLRNATEVVSRQALTNEDLTETELEDMAKDTLREYMISADGLVLAQESVTQNGVEFNELTATYAYTPLIMLFMPESFNHLDFSVTVSRPLNWTDD